MLKLAALSRVKSHTASGFSSFVQSKGTFAIPNTWLSFLLIILQSKDEMLGYCFADV